MSEEEVFESHRLSKTASLRNAANRLLFSKFYTTFYIVMICVNLVLIIWIIVNASILQRVSTPSHWMFLVLELFINFALAFEVSLRFMSLGKRYFSSCSNIFDLTVLVLSCAGLVLYFTSKNESGTDLSLEKAENIIATVLLIFRYIVQFLRLVLLVKNHRKAIKPPSMVDFRTIPEDVEDPFTNNFGNVTPEESQPLRNSQT